MVQQQQARIPLGNPLTPISQFFNQLAENAQQHPLAKQVNGAIGQLQQRMESARESRRYLEKQRQRGPRIVVPPRAAPFAAIIPGDTIAEQVVTTGFLNFLNLYNTALIIRITLTWFPSVPEAISSPLSTVCDPYLNLFRGIIPPLGGTLDLSPILAFVTLNFFTSAAAALPAELGPDGVTPGPRKQPEGWQQWLQPSRYEQLWQRRVAAARAIKEGPGPEGSP